MEKIRYGIVGGGPGSFIGQVHKMAAALDGEYALVAGCFSTHADKNRAAGVAHNVAAARVYDNFAEMAAGESQVPENERIQVVVNATPNDLHYEVSRTFMEHGFSVISDKPLTLTLDEARDLYALHSEKQVTFALTHVYTGYPMVKEAKHRFAQGEIGKLRRVIVEYIQGWVPPTLDAAVKKKAWKFDPERVGRMGCMADIGIHAENLLHYITGERIESLNALLVSHLEGSPLDNDGTVMFKLPSGVFGSLVASQICTGEGNGLSIRLYGDRGFMKWRQEDPEELSLFTHDKGLCILRKGRDVGEQAAWSARIPIGHPEGLIEAMANIYRQVAKAMRQGSAQGCDFPGMEDGLAGMKFLEAVYESNQNSQVWVQV